MTDQPVSSAAVSSAVLIGSHGLPVWIEALVRLGLPGFTIVGLPDTAGREVRDRVRAAFLSSGLAWPNRHITVTVEPEHGRVRAAGLDLPIALALLAAAGELPPDRLLGVAGLGELGLDGSLRPVPGVVPLVEATAAATVVVPSASRADAELVAGRTIRSAPDLQSALRGLRGDGWPSHSPPPSRARPASRAPDLADVRCSTDVRRAVEVAAAGGHHLLLVDAADSGIAAALAHCLANLLPPLDVYEALETARIHSAAGQPISLDGLRVPPFRAPHAGTPVVALVGGGGVALAPGELSLAHNGVLLLEDVDAYERAALDAVTAALDNRTARVSRARSTVELPARVLAMATRRICPCMSADRSSCRCSKQALDHHARRLGLPFFDRFPIRATISSPSVSTVDAEPTAVVAARVADARSIARRRGARDNAHLTSRDDVALSGAAGRALDHQRRLGALSARALDDTRRVARTVADLRGAELVDEVDVLEAVALRVLRNVS